MEGKHKRAILPHDGVGMSHRQRGVHVEPEVWLNKSYDFQVHLSAFAQACHCRSRIRGLVFAASSSHLTKGTGNVRVVV
jgi:hypothetical protein